MLGDYSSIAEDLEYLTRDWHSEIESADLRRGSSVVRRLLVDGGNARLLLDAWRAYGFNGQPIVRGPDLMEDVKGPLKTVSWASAGGIRVRSSAGAVGAVVVYNVGPSPVPEVKHSISYDPYPEWSLAEYVQAACAITEGELILRREMIKYFANYLGGVHLNVSGKVHRKDSDMIRRIERRLKRLKIDGFERRGRT